MPELAVHTFVWTGFKGAPGISTFVALHSLPENGQGFAEAVRAFFNSLGPIFSTSINIKSQPTYRIVDEATGALISELVYPAAIPAVQGLGPVTFAGPAGAVVDWVTGTIGTRRNIRGRTFLVPLSTDVYDTDGTLKPASVQGIRDAAAQLIVATNANFVIWRRPRPAQVAPKVPRPAVVGKAGLVVSSKVPDMAAMLRTRR